MCHTDILRLVHVYDRYYILIPTGGRLLREDLYQANELQVRPQICDLLADDKKNFLRPVLCDLLADDNKNFLRPVPGKSRSLT